MADEEREQPGGEPRPRGASGIEVRPRNWLVPVILLAHRECTSYGYKLMEQMEKFGLCKSEWDTSSGGGPARRVYTITDAGEAYLGFWIEALEQYRRNMDFFFSLYTGKPPTQRNQQEDGG